MQEYEERIHELDQALRSVQKELKDVLQERTSHESLADEVKRENDRLIREISDLNEQLKSSKELHQLEKSRLLDSLKEAEEFHSERLAKLNKEIEELTQDRKAWTDRCDSLEHESMIKERDYTETISSLQIRVEQECKQAESLISELRSQIQDMKANDNRDELVGEIDFLRNQVDDVQSVLKQKEESLTAINTKCKDLESALAARESELTRASETIEGLKKEISFHEAEYGQALAEMQQLRDLLEQANSGKASTQELQDVVSRLQAELDEAIDLKNQQEEELFHAREEVDKLMNKISELKSAPPSQPQDDSKTTALEKDIETMARVIQNLMSENRRLQLEVNEGFPRSPGATSPEPRLKQNPDHELLSILYQMIRQVTDLSNSFEDNARFVEKIYHSLANQPNWATLLQDYLTRHSTLASDLRRIIGDMTAANNLISQRKNGRESPSRGQPDISKSIGRLSDKLENYSSLLHSLMKRRDIRGTDFYSLVFTLSH